MRNSEMNEPGDAFKDLTVNNVKELWGIRITNLH